MKVVFRVDASLQIGNGHVMRCLTLALILKKNGANIRFICRKHKGNLIDEIRSKDYLIHIHTGRHILNSSLTINWLKENKIIYDHIVFGKPPAKYYIDDKGIEFDNWSSVLKKINL